MRISFDLPNELVQVIDTENYKGVPVTVLRMFGENILYFTGRQEREETYRRNNADWEQVIRWRLADHFREILLQDSTIAANWQEDNPTGRELRDSNYDEIHYVRED